MTHTNVDANVYTSRHDAAAFSQAEPSFTTTPSIDDEACPTFRTARALSRTYLTCTQTRSSKAILSSGCLRRDYSAPPRLL